jgi:hypothetical protein
VPFITHKVWYCSHYPDGQDKQIWGRRQAIGSCEHRERERQQGAAAMLFGRSASRGVIRAETSVKEDILGKE